MNSTLATFLKIAITAVAIGAFLFGVAYTMVQDEGALYETKIEGVQGNLPIIP